MSKRIKRIIAITLTLTAFLTILPIKNSRIIKSNITAYASSDDDDDDEEEDEYKAIENSYLDDLNVSEGTLNFMKKKTDYTIRVDGSDESITITAVAKNSTDIIRIDGSEVSLDSNKRAEKTVELEKGRNLIKIKVETQDYGIRTYNLVINRGSASSSDSSSDFDGVYLSNIDLSDGEIEFTKNRLIYNVNVSSSINEIRVTAEPEDDTYEVRINGVKVDSDESYRRTLELSNGKNIVTIDLENDDGKQQTYTLNIYRTTAIDNTEVIDNIQDPIYLDDLIIEDGDIPIKFKPKVTSYAVDVNDSYDSIIIKAKPEHDDIVLINGSKFEKSYVRRVSLNEGKNIIKIQVNNNNSYDQSDSEYEERTYTLTVYRGTSQGTSKGEITNENNTSNVKVNSWTSKDGKWQYIDSAGNPLKSTWYFDKNYGKNYYFKDDGTMAIGWILYNGEWYYLDSSGAMITGWFEDVNGNWYYLNTSGVMVKNTVINGYKIGSDGAWIK